MTWRPEVLQRSSKGALCGKPSLMRAALVKSYLNRSRIRLLGTSNRWTEDTVVAPYKHFILKYPHPISIPMWQLFCSGRRIRTILRYCPSDCKEHGNGQN